MGNGIFFFLLIYFIIEKNFRKIKVKVKGAKWLKESFKDLFVLVIFL